MWALSPEEATRLREGLAGEEVGMLFVVLVALVGSGDSGAVAVVEFVEEQPAIAATITARRTTTPTVDRQHFIGSALLELRIPSSSAPRSAHGPKGQEGTRFCLAGGDPLADYSVRF
jgi:hypothetical protein